MNAIQYALMTIFATIPREILEEAYYDVEWRRNQIPLSLEEMIRTTTIENRVAVDMNMFGGTECNVDITGLNFQEYGIYNRVYRVPKDRTQGRKITNVLNIGHVNGYVQPYYGVQRNQANIPLNGAMGIAAAYQPIPLVSNAYVSLIGENVVLVKGNVSLPPGAMLRCWLAYDSELTQIQPPTYQQFGQMCLMAVKSYIYTILRVKIDKNALYGGYDLGVIREIVSEYNESEQNYQTYLVDIWRAVSILNDPEAKTRHLMSIVGGRY